MKALTARGIGDVVVGEVPDPVIGSGQVLVRVKVSAVSAGTERRMLYGRPDDVREHAPDFPIVGAFGYLAAGEVIEIGEDVEGLSVGDRVSCGRSWGAHRELLDTDASSVIRIPDDMSYIDGAASYWAVPPFAGILAAAPRMYSDTAVIGLGPLGLCAVQLLLSTSRSVLAIDLLESRIEAAATYGAIAMRPEEAKRDLTENLTDGPEIVIEAAGTQAGLELALEIVRPLGRIALVGVPPPLDGMDLFWPMQHKGVRLVPLHRESTTSPQGGGAGSPRATYLPDIIHMISNGRLDISGLVSWVVPIEEGPQAFAILKDHPDRVLGIGFSWEPGLSENYEVFATLVAAGAQQPGALSGGTP